MIMLDDLATRYPAPEDIDAEGGLALAVERLTASGTEDVFLFPLGDGEDGVHVVRALAPGLQAFAGDGLGVFGAQGLAALVATAERGR
jgi:ribosomal protein S12 methylthiotransferase accessory factor YcaO